ncbi:hypothetical protein KFL_002880020 [Klebsormidium nitens]|uniref:Tc1-like transposase DDE domain-containing protein n=1 Tax=Klebsormidium nitens TaxID=105231 RepID=A0A0U9HL09_KLENI|nr:hypothetical protein KFL_002880020 [Klebsormidium nitens]|eukprot:GAQ86418.1 hypothetical protein KFL_002880020 [Klebsormidium nitens]
MAQTLEGRVEQPWISETSIWRIMKEQLGLSHKKLSLIASQQMTAENEARREAYLAEALQVPAEEILVADETAFSYNNGLRRYGWAPAHGETRAVDIRPKVFCPNHSCIGVLSTEGFEHVSIKKGAVDGEDWWEFICQCEPIFASGKFKLFVADNASVHKRMEELVRHLLQEYGIKLLYLPAYSPDLSPIEEAFSKVKVVAQDGREDVRRDMESHIVRGFGSVTPDDARGYFRLYTR